MEFKKLAKEIIEERSNERIEQRLCPDQYVGEIGMFTSDSGDFPIRKSAEKRPSDLSCLIMILESPHIAEFKENPSPAMGSTGKLIRDHILSVKGLSAFKDFGLVLMNAIRNQCSLGFPTRYYRDEVFMSVWNEGGKDRFIKRLNTLYRDGDVILNCCTKGSGTEELRQIVQRCIPSDKGNILRRTHPSSWYSKTNRNSEWKLA